MVLLARSQTSVVSVPIVPGTSCYSRTASSAATTSDHLDGMSLLMLLPLTTFVRAPERGPLVVVRHAISYHFLATLFWLNRRNPSTVGRRFIFLCARPRG